MNKQNQSLTIRDLKTLKILVIQKMNSLKNAYEEICGKPVQFGSPEQDHLDYLLVIVNKLEDMEGNIFRQENIRKFLEGYE